MTRFLWLTLSVWLSACDKKIPDATATSVAHTTIAPVAAPAVAPANLLPQPSESAHFEYVPGHENWKTPDMRGDSKTYKSSWFYSTCMKVQPHRQDEAEVCKDLNDLCVDNSRSQERCDADGKESGPSYLSKVKRLDDPKDPTGGSFFAAPNSKGGQ